MKKIASSLSLALLIILVNCSGDEIIPDYEYKVILTFQDNDLFHYEKYDQGSGALIEEGSYEYLPGKIVETISKSGKLYSHKVFTMNGLLASECADTIFLDGNVNEVYQHTYSYAGGKLYSDDYIYQRYINDSLIISEVTVVCTFNDKDNLTRRETIRDSGADPFNCYNDYEYSDRELQFDVFDFNSAFYGATPANLISKATYDLNCPGGPSYIYPLSTFSYATDKAGYISSLTEKYVSGYASSTTYTKTLFEYIFN